MIIYKINIIIDNNSNNHIYYIKNNEWHRLNDSPAYLESSCKDSLWKINNKLNRENNQDYIISEIKDIHLGNY